MGAARDLRGAQRSRPVEDVVPPDITWRRDKVGFETPERPWIPGGKQRAHLPEALTWQKALPLMDEAGIDRAIIVPPTWPREFNDHALEAAAAAGPAGRPSGPAPPG